jgi:hypothetical protein
VTPLRLASLVLGGPVAGLLVAISLGGCGGSEAPQQAKTLIESASHELKPALGADLAVKTSEDSRVVAEVKREDGSTETWTTIKDAGDWILDACEVTDNSGITENCIPDTQEAPGSFFIDCISQIQSPDLWSLCSPLLGPDAGKQAEAEQSWQACMTPSPTSVIPPSAARCALLLEG